MKARFKGIIIAISLITGLIITGCSQDSKSDWTEHDLVEYGLPLKIMAPDSIEVEKSDFAGQKDIRIKAGDNYSLQLFVAEATAADMDGLIKSLMNTVESNRYFSRMVQTYDDGFIYELNIDSTHQYYGFRRVFIKGDKEYVVQNNLLGVKSEEKAKRLFESIE